MKFAQYAEDDNRATGFAILPQPAFSVGHVVEDGRSMIVFEHKLAKEAGIKLRRELYSDPDQLLWGPPNPKWDFQPILFRGAQFVKNKDLVKAELGILESWIMELCRRHKNLRLIDLFPLNFKIDYALFPKTECPNRLEMIPHDELFPETGYPPALVKRILKFCETYGHPLWSAGKMGFEKLQAGKEYVFDLDTENYDKVIPNKIGVKEFLERILPAWFVWVMGIKPEIEPYQLKLGLDTETLNHFLTSTDVCVQLCSGRPYFVAPDLFRLATFQVAMCKLPNPRIGICVMCGYLFVKKNRSDQDYCNDPCTKIMALRERKKKEAASNGDGHAEQG